MVARNLPGGLRPGNPHNITLEGISGLTPAVLRVSADPDLEGHTCRLGQAWGAAACAASMTWRSRSPSRHPRQRNVHRPGNDPPPGGVPTANLHLLFDGRAWPVSNAPRPAASFSSRWAAHPSTASRSRLSTPPPPPPKGPPAAGAARVRALPPADPSRSARRSAIGHFGLLDPGQKLYHHGLSPEPQRALHRLAAA